MEKFLLLLFSVFAMFSVLGALPKVKFNIDRLGGILKGGRLWRSNSNDGKKAASTPPDEPDIVKCSEARYVAVIVYCLRRKLIPFQSRKVRRDLASYFVFVLCCAAVLINHKWL